MSAEAHRRHRCRGAARRSTVGPELGASNPVAPHRFPPPRRASTRALVSRAPQAATGASAPSAPSAPSTIDASPSYFSRTERVAAGSAGSASHPPCCLEQTDEGKPPPTSVLLAEGARQRTGRCAADVPRPSAAGGRRRGSSRRRRPTAGRRTSGSPRRSPGAPVGGICRAHALPTGHPSMAGCRGTSPQDLLEARVSQGRSRQPARPSRVQPRDVIQRVQGARRPRARRSTPDRDRPSRVRGIFRGAGTILPATTTIERLCADALVERPRPPVAAAFSPGRTLAAARHRGRRGRCRRSPQAARRCASRSGNRADDRART